MESLQRQLGAGALDFVPTRELAWLFIQFLETGTGRELQVVDLARRRGRGWRLLGLRLVRAGASSMGR